MPRMIVAVAVALIVALGSEVALADLDQGIAAYRQGKYKAALAALEPLAKKGDLQAQYYLGEMYLRGDGVSQDFKKAVAWYDKSAEAGLPEAQAAMSGLSLLGLGTKRNYQSGYFWAIVSVIWSKSEIRKSAMRALTQVSRMLDKKDKAEIARDAVEAWRR